VNPPQPLAFLILMSAAKSVGYYLSIHIQKSDVLVSVCAKKIAMIASLNGGHTH